MQQKRANSNLVEDLLDDTNKISLNIRSMLDPDEIYSTTLGAADVSHSTMHIPNIQNGDGDLITPDQYEQALEDGSVVMVNVYLKMYVFFSFINIDFLIFN